MNPSGLVKVAVCCAQKLPKMFDLDQSEPLDQVVARLCGEWELAGDPTNFSLKSEESKALSKGSYITDSNRKTLHDGDVLQLEVSPEIMAMTLLKQLQSPDAAGIPLDETLDQLSTETRDPTFSKLFFDTGGMDELKKQIDVYRIDVNQQNNLALALCAYSKLVSHGGEHTTIRTAFRGVQQDFILDLLNLTKRDGIQASVIHSVLDIAGAFVEHTEKGFQLVEDDRNLGLNKVIEYMDSRQSRDIQEAAVALINILISNCAATKRSAILRTIAINNVVGMLRSRVVQPKQISRSFAHQLYELQTHLLSGKGLRAKTWFNSADPKNKDDINALTDALPASPSATLEQDKQDKLQKLGFEDPTRPGVAFENFPGVLALDNMAWMTAPNRYQKEYQQLYQRQMSRPPQYVCPFVATGKDLTALLLTLLHVNVTPQPLDKNSINYLPLFFTTPNPFEELFCIGMQLVDRTWTEMDARDTDRAKVMNIVNKQLTLVFSQEMPVTLDQFRSLVLSKTYRDIQNIQNREMDLAFEAMLAAPVTKKVKERHRKESAELVYQQRLSYLCEGAYFATINKGRVTKQRFFAIVSANHKRLYWTKLEESFRSEPTIAEMESSEGGGSILVEDFIQIEVGEEVPHLKTLRERRQAESLQRFCFAVAVNSSTTGGAVQLDPATGMHWLTFIIPERTEPDRERASIWMDGVRLLKDKLPKEQETMRAVDTVLKLKMNLLLLNCHGANLPSMDVKVPPAPEDLDFVNPDTMATSDA